MIGLQELTAGIAGYLQRVTGVQATAERAVTPEYPCLLVEARSKSEGMTAGGRQVERRVTVNVICLPSRLREREAGLTLADRVYDVLVPGFPACGRTFCPETAEVWLDEKERARVEVTLSFCDRPAEEWGGGTAAVPTMGSLTLRLTHKKEEM